jgi:hypothetical protein
VVVLVGPEMDVEATEDGGLCQARAVLGQMRMKSGEFGWMKAAVEGERKGKVDVWTVGASGDGGPRRPRVRNRYVSHLRQLQASKVTAALVRP